MPKYCILPSGNSSEFPELDAELMRRGVTADYSSMSGGGRIYRIRRGMRKLPRDDKGPYLGNDNSGHSIYAMVEIETFRTDCNGSDWIKIK